MPLSPISEKPVELSQELREILSRPFVITEEPW